MADGSWREHLSSIRPDAATAEAEWWDTSWDSQTPPAVGFLIPRGFEAYVRVLHPAATQEGSPVPWAEVARVCGTTLHPQSQWERLAFHGDLDPRGEGPDPVRWMGAEPAKGSLDRAPFEALDEVLARHTATPERTIVALWVGYGQWPRAWAELPSTGGPILQAYLFERALVDVRALCAEAPAVRLALGEDDGAFGGDRPLTPEEWIELAASHQWQSPSAWWPDDRAWAISSDTDLDSTLVGGSNGLIDDLLASDVLEVLRWPVDGSLWSGADLINVRAGDP